MDLLAPEGGPGGLPQEKPQQCARSGNTLRPSTQSALAKVPVLVYSSLCLHTPHSRFCDLVDQLSSLRQGMTNGLALEDSRFSSPVHFVGQETTISYNPGWS
jgi:hypothetical protein